MSDELLGPTELLDRIRAAGLTVSVLCERAGIAESTFRRWKRGTNGITVDTYQRLRRVMIEAERVQQAAAE